MKLGIDNIEFIDYEGQKINFDVILLLINYKDQFELKAVKIIDNEFDEFELEWIQIYQNSKNAIEAKIAILTSPRMKFFKRGSYCLSQNLSKAYQNPVNINYTATENKFIKGKLSEERLLQSRFNDEKELDREKFDEKLESLKTKCLNVIRSIKTEKLLNFCQKDDRILMYSHNYRGWNLFDHSLNNDFKMSINSNFGYGSSSYFYSIITYKGLKINPYVDLIKYRFAKAKEILNYTNKYECKNESWFNSLENTKDSIEFAERDENEFVKINIISKLDEFLKGLQDVVYDKIDYRNDVEGFNLLDQSKPFSSIYKKGYNEYEFKIDRLSEALDFIDTLSKWETELGRSGIVIEIKILADFLVSQYGKELESINSLLDKDRKEYQIILKEYTILNAKHRKYFLQLSKLWTNSGKKESFKSFIDAQDNALEVLAYVKTTKLKSDYEYEIYRQEAMIDRLKLAHDKLSLFKW